jgi:hypothetical protein
MPGFSNFGFYCVVRVSSGITRLGLVSLPVEIIQIPDFELSGYGLEYFRF